MPLRTQCLSFGFLLGYRTQLALKFLSCINYLMHIGERANEQCFRFNCHLLLILHIRFRMNLESDIIRLSYIKTASCKIANVATEVSVVTMVIIGRTPPPPPPTPLCDSQPVKPFWYNIVKEQLDFGLLSKARLHDISSLHVKIGIFILQLKWKLCVEGVGTRPYSALFNSFWLVWFMTESFNVFYHNGALYSQKMRSTIM